MVLHCQISRHVHLNSVGMNLQRTWCALVSLLPERQRASQTRLIDVLSFNGTDPNGYAISVGLRNCDYLSVNLKHHSHRNNLTETNCRHTGSAYLPLDLLSTQNGK